MDNYTNSGRLENKCQCDKTAPLNPTEIHEDVISGPSSATDVVATGGWSSKPQCNILESLPEEILMFIIDLLSADASNAIGRHTTNKLIINLSLVCKFFRHLVVDTPSLWTKIDHPYCEKPGLETRLMRAKNLPLFVDMVGVENIPPAFREEGLSRMFLLKDRWQRLRVNFGHLGWQDLVQSHPVREFSHVEIASLRFSPFDIVDSFFDEWKFPNLISLRTHNAIPPSSVFRNLVELDISTNRTWAYKYPNHEKLLELLRSTPRVERLSLHLAGCLKRPCTPAPIQLPSVTTVSLSNYYDPSGGSLADGTEMHLIHLLESLEIPKVRDFHLAIVFPDKRRLLTWFNSMRRFKETLLSVTSFTIISEFRPKKDTLKQVLRMCPNIRELRLDVVETIKMLRSLNCCLGLNHLQSVHIVKWPGESDVHFEVHDLRILTKDASDVILTIKELHRRRDRHPFSISSRS